MNKSIAIAGITLLSITGLACNKKDATEATPDAVNADTAKAEALAADTAKPDEAKAEEAVPAAGAAKEAAEIFALRCVACHGNTGKGDGLAAASLNPKPRSYADATWQASVKDDDLRKVIVKGGPAAGKSVLMPGNPDLEKKPEVVNEIIKIIRAFAPKK